MASSEADHEVPFDIELPTPILLWTPLEFILAISLMGFGLIANVWVLGLLAGAFVLIGARYLKRGSKAGAMQHFLWALGLQMDVPLSTKFPPAWRNDFYN